MRGRASIALVSAAALIVSGCGGGGSSPTPVVTPPPPPAPAALYAVPAQESLSASDVERIMAQAIAEAQARNLPSVIAVVDRVGNVLGVFRMNGARATVATSAAPNGQNVDLQGAQVPAEAAAIAKAITGAYLSSGGNAFSTRTASQIVQANFPPAPSTVGLESGPLFGVQFSSLPCSDLAARFGAEGLIGPKRSPLGLAADAGGFPLYKNGVVVGGIGVMGDGSYDFDPDILDVDADPEEFIALAGTTGFEAPAAIRAERITVDGTALRYSDATAAGLMATGAAPGFATLNGTAGSLIAVTGYTTAATSAGAAYGSEASGIRAATAAEFANRDAFVLSNGVGNARYPVRGGQDGASIAQPLSEAEARALLEQAFLIMSRARAQIRQPLDSRAQVSISLVDTFGSILGIVRSPDAPLFGIDVSLQKARTAAFFTSARAANLLAANPSADVAAMAAAARSFFNDPAALTGKNAFGDRTIGNLARPHFPDGEAARPPGPFGRPIQQFNPFGTGLQAALIAGNVVEHLTFMSGGSAQDTDRRCTATPDVAPGLNPLQNGIQIFPGAVPIFRGNLLVGAIGVSGDGIDQDDMISFLGAHNGGIKAGGGIGNAPAAIRSDQIVIPLSGSPGVRLRYVSCPFAPFLDTSEQNVCQGL